MSTIPNSGAIPPRALQSYAAQQNISAGQTEQTQTGPVDSGLNPRNVANLKLGNNWRDLTGASAEKGTHAYKDVFGDQSYVKDLKSENLKNVLGELPDNAVPGLKEKAKSGSLQEADIKQLQTMLSQKGFDLGPTGVDGKFGPKTHEALEHFIKGDAPSGGAPKQQAPNAKHDDPRAGGAQNTAPAPANQTTQSNAGSQTTPGPDGVMHTGKTTGVPEGYQPLSGQVPPGVADKAKSLLGLGFGDAVPFEIDGKRYMARIEHHYHPPGYVGGPNGWHKGCTVYQAE